MVKQPVKRAGLYARISLATGQRDLETQLQPLRAYATARGWIATEYTDTISGSKTSRPGLDRLMSACRTRQIDVLVIVKLDRLGRSLAHLVSVGAELSALGVDLVVLDQAIDTTTPAGRLLFGVLGSIAEFERDLIRERVMAGLARARAQGKHLGRRTIPAAIEQRIRRELEKGLGIRRVARRFKVGTSTAHRIAKALR